MVFSFSYCFVVLTSDSFSCNAIPERFLGALIRLSMPRSHCLKRGTKELLIYVKLSSVWWVADGLALCCISKVITCVFLGKLFLLLKLYIILSSIHKGIHSCFIWNFYVLVRKWLTKLKWKAAWADLDPQTINALELELPFVFETEMSLYSYTYMYIYIPVSFCYEHR